MIGRPDTAPARLNGGFRSSIAARVGQALDASLRSSIGAHHFGLDGRLAQWSAGLVAGVDRTLLRVGRPADRGRLRQPDNSATLAINSFLNWQRCPQLLRLAGHRGFRQLSFEVRCPTGVRGTPPLLELIAVDDRDVVAVTARCAEYLGRSRSKFAAGYAQLPSAPALAPWTELLRSLREQPRQFRYVDASPLARHAIGLGKTFPDRAVTLLYLFWEPVDGARCEPFREHRAELAALAARVAGGAVALVGQSFHELWAEWEELHEPDWLRGIVARLKLRYDVAMADLARL